MSLAEAAGAMQTSTGQMPSVTVGWRLVGNIHDPAQWLKEICQGKGLPFQELPRQAGVVSAGPVKRVQGLRRDLEGHLELPRQAGVVPAGAVKRGRASGEGLEGHLELSF